MPTVAALISFHQNEQFLIEALASVLQQTHPPDEVIVVDDASPTGGNLAALLPRGVRLIRHTKNTGIGGARQTAILAASTDLVAFLDGDDLWLPDKLERQLAFLAAHPEADMVHTGTVTFRRDGTERVFNDRSPVLGFAVELRRNQALMQTAMLRRETALSLGGFRASRRFVPDWDFVIRLLDSGGQILCLAEPLTRVRRWDHGNISSSGLRQMRRRIATLLEHWPLLRREIGLKGGVEAIAGIVSDEGSKVGHRLGGLWRGAAMLLRGFARLVPGRGREGRGCSL